MASTCRRILRHYLTPKGFIPTTLGKIGNFARPMREYNVRGKISYDHELQVHRIMFSSAQFLVNQDLFPANSPLTNPAFHRNTGF
jgi:hypothetical protein